MVKVFGTEDTRVKTVDIVSLKITSPIKIIVIEAISTPTICSNVLNQDVKTVSSNYEHLKRIESPETTKCIDVLMGVDYYYSCITGEVKRGKDYEPIAINSCFGWIVCGYYEQPYVSTNFVNSAHMLRTNTELLNKFEEIKSENTFNDDLKNFFMRKITQKRLSMKFIYHSKKIYVLIIKKRDTRQGFRLRITLKFYHIITI